MKNQKGFTLIELSIVVFIVFLLALGPICLHYSVNYWLVFAGKTPKFGWLPSVFLGIPLSELSVPAAAITFIISFFL